MAQLRRDLRELEAKRVRIPYFAFLAFLVFLVFLALLAFLAFLAFLVHLSVMAHTTAQWDNREVSTFSPSFSQLSYDANKVQNGFMQSRILVSLASACRKNKDLEEYVQLL